MGAGFKRSENVESKSASEKDTNNDHAKKKKKDVVYYDYKELMRQRGLWYEAEKKHPWYDPPPKIRTKYKKGKVMLMKEFHGDYKVEPIYVDQKRLCKKRLPKSPEEYKKCSGGQGRIGSKLTINHYFQPYPPFNIPPLSWFIHGITIKTSKNLLNALQEMALIVREAGPPSEEAIKAREKNIIEVHNF
ncbi:hypothetical protein Bca52824_076674 [Brassica carinata]|uniref:DUF220 domain-containing protein n=1 Tax=Brassica carinata TaxID=52824 RepID=A0A8X7PUA6_BRACI|nr:hypothetical protein Bca52824_076674 [Brassica carinata]